MLEFVDDVDMNIIYIIFFIITGIYQFSENILSH